jgi:hypothetical protein
MAVAPAAAGLVTRGAGCQKDMNFGTVGVDLCASTWSVVTCGAAADRSADTAADWVGSIRKSRSSAAIALVFMWTPRRQGAPQARQVADLFERRCPRGDERIRARDNLVDCGFHPDIDFDECPWRRLCPGMDAVQLVVVPVVL